jgi:16S rRNA (uracil1498-N3)-methyltransferase
MRIPRIFLSTSLQEGINVELPPAATNHLIRVLRLPINAKLTVFNGDGGEYQASIVEIGKKSCVVAVGTYIDKTNESSLSIHLAQGIAHGDKMDFIIQKAVELGVTQITPLLTQFGDVRISGDRLAKRLQHWRNIVISACEQCGRNKIPIIWEPKPIINWLSASSEVTTADSSNALRLILHPYAAEPLPSLSKPPQQLSLIIGPEGGFSDKEVKVALDYGCSPISLGPRILRTETASITAISIVQHLWGDL